MKIMFYFFSAIIVIAVQTKGVMVFAQPDSTATQEEMFKMNDEKNRLERGKKVIKQVYGERVTVPENAADIPFWRLMLTSTFAEMWPLEELSIRDKRLILIGSIAATAKVDVLEIQFNAALDKGELDIKQLREIPVILHHYIGLPRTSEVALLVEKLIEERSKE